MSPGLYPALVNTTEDDMTNEQNDRCKPSCTCTDCKCGPNCNCGK